MTFVRVPALLFALLSSVVAVAAPSETEAPVTSTDVDYGEMYVIQKHDPAPKLWQVGLAYTYGFSNPYIGIHGGQLNLSRRLSEFVSVGLVPEMYKTTPKAVAAEISRNLEVDGVRTTVYEPRYSGHAMVSVTPLSGMLNWFSTSAVDFDFVLSGGIGATQYRQASSLIPSFRLAATPQVMLTKFFGVSGGIQATIERFPDNDWQNRVDTVLGVSGRF